MIALLLALQVASVGSVEGRVVGLGEEPLASAEVRVDGLGRSVRTGVSGSYLVDSIPDGRWLVRAWARGYVEQNVVVRVEGGARVRLDFELEPVTETAPPPPHTFSGVVLEGGRLEPIHFATVEVATLGRRAMTDEDGLFALGGLPGRRWTLRVSAPGYVTLEREIDAESGARPVELHLEPRPLPLAEVIVEGSRIGGRVRSGAPEARVVDSTLVSMIPVTFEKDVLRGMQLLPSMTPGSDFSSAPYVRGGTPGQTRIFLDGAPLHNPFHVGGFVSAFEPSAMGATVLRPGGLPASAVSGLSGVLELHTRDGGRDSVRVDGSLGLLSSSATVSGPWRGGSYMLSGRRTYLDLGFGAARGLGLTDAAMPYRFWDLLGKVTRDLGGRDRSVTLSGYLDREGWRDDEYRASWGTDAMSLRFRGLVSDGLLAEGGVATSGFVADFLRTERSSTAPGGVVVSDFDASMRSWAGDASLEGERGAHLLSAGVRWEVTTTGHDLDPEGRLVSLFTPLDVSGRYGSAALFARDRWRLGRSLSLDGGLRAEKPTRAGWTLLPRGRLELGIGERGSVALASGRYVQNWWSLRNEEGVAASVVAYDVTLPIPEGLPLSKSWDVVLEGRTEIGRWALRADLFHRVLDDVTTSPVEADPSDARVTIDPDSVRLGRQRVDGVEIFAVGSLRGTPLALSYRMQRARATVDDDTFIPRTDRTHRLSLNGRRAWGERQVAFSLTWMSGRPYTPALAALPSFRGPGTDGRIEEVARFGGPPIALGAANSARMSSYLRVDLDFRGSWDATFFGRRGAIEPYVSILNVFNAHNPLWARHVVRDGRLALELGPQIPLVPTFGLRWRF